MYRLAIWVIEICYIYLCIFGILVLFIFIGMYNKLMIVHRDINYNWQCKAFGCSWMKCTCTSVEIYWDILCYPFWFFYCQFRNFLSFFKNVLYKSIFYAQLFLSRHKVHRYHIRYSLLFYCVVGANGTFLVLFLFSINI